jgi:DNA-directed RNA polymerase specialized sigma24 family protein
VLQHYLGMSLSEIAEIQRVPVGTVRSRLHYARRVMRGALESDARQTIPRGQPQ